MIVKARFERKDTFAYTGIFVVGDGPNDQGLHPIKMPDEIKSFTMGSIYKVRSWCRDSVYE